MASVLYRLGGWTFDHRRLVVAIWVAVVLGFGALAAAVGGSQSNSFTVPGTESQRALDLLKKEFPGTGGAVARIVFGGGSRGVRDVLVDGTLLVRGGAPLLFDPAEIRAKAAEALPALLQRAQVA